MTGTAATEAAEFSKIYNLEVTIIPTNQTLIRIEAADVVYRTEKEKFEAVVNGIMQEDNSFANGIRHLHERGPARAGRNNFHRKNRKPSRNC